MQGHVSREGVPTISVEIGDEPHQAIINTGCNGELELSRTIKI